MATNMLAALGFHPEGEELRIELPESLAGANLKAAFEKAKLLGDGLAGTSLQAHASVTLGMPSKTPCVPRMRTAV